MKEGYGTQCHPMQKGRQGDQLCQKQEPSETYWVRLLSQTDS